MVKSYGPGATASPRSSSPSGGSPGRVNRDNNFLTNFVDGFTSLITKKKR